MTRPMRRTRLREVDRIDVPADERSLYLGIDPGCSGALVLIEQDGTFVDHLLMPVIVQGSTSRVNGAAISAFLRGRRVKHAYIELVASMPKQGVASTFTFGHAAGLVQGVVVGAEIPYTLITPNKWKAAVGLRGSDKDVARSRAVQLYPGLRILDTKAKGQAVADALFLARVGLGIH